MTPEMGWSRAEQLPSCRKVSTMSPHSPRAPWLCMPTSLAPPGATFSREGRLKVQVLPVLDVPICCVTGEQQLLLGCTLDPGDALLHMRAAPRQEGGQGSPHPAEEDDAALFRL